MQASSDHYRVMAFVRDSDGETVSILSNSIYLASDTHDVHHAEFSSDESRAIVLKNRSSYRYSTIFIPGPSSKRLFVFLPSARKVPHNKQPRFDRLNRAATGLFPGSCLFLSDPLWKDNLTLKTSWMIGTREESISQDLSELISVVANRLNISLRDVTLWGSSAGGFAALNIAASMGHASAVAINSQTNIAKFTDKETVEKAYLIFSQCSDTASFANEADLRNKWNPEITSRVCLVQNKLDAHHYDHHWLPFWLHLGGSHVDGLASACSHRSLTYLDPNGHCAESIGMTKMIISDMLGINDELTL